MNIPERILHHINTGYKRKLLEITCFGHADTTINNGESFVSLVRNKAYEELRLSIKFALVSQALEPNLIQCIRCIADQFPQENFLVAVESIDDQTEKLVDLSLESKGLCISHLNIRHNSTT